MQGDKSVMTPIPEIIFSGFVSKAVNDILDISKDKIKRTVKSENTKHQNIESQIYKVILDVLNKMIRNQYEDNQDRIFDATETLLKSFKKNEGDELESIRSCLRIIGLDANETECSEFKVSLYEELVRDEYGMLFRAVLLLLLSQKNKYDNAVSIQLNQKLDEVDSKLEKIDLKLDEIQKCNSTIIVQDKDTKFQNNKKQKYIENWNSPMFLHIDNEDNPITLADAFIMPDYILYRDGYKIDYRLDTKLSKVIHNVINYRRSTTLLIQGVPGMGKSSVVSWISNKYKENDNIIILRFRNWEYKDLKCGLLEAISNTLKCEKADIENKIVVLDGFDEIKSVSNRSSLLNSFLNDILDYENLKVIITSRFDYLEERDFKNVVNLKPFDIIRICKFYHIITNRRLDGSKIKDTSIIGIPVILYMAIMSNIDITEETTRPNLYNHIFAEKGGIFDRFSNKGGGYDGGAHPLRNKENVKIYLKFLRKIAFDMFEENDLSIERKEDKIPKLDFQGGRISVLEFPVKHLFEKTELNIEFIHKSIYEYFVAEYIFKVLKKNINESKEDFADTLGRTFKRNRLSKEIIEYLQYKFQTNSDLKEKYRKIYETFQLMLQKGMTFHVKEKYENSMDCEINIFANMLDVLHLWDNINLELSNCLCKYIKYNKRDRLNLKYISVEGKNEVEIDLNGVYLVDADLCYSCLQGVDFCGSNLRRAKFVNAKLSRVNLSRTDLTGVKFKDVIMSEVEFGYTSLKETEFENVDFRGVDIKKMDITEVNLNGGIFNEEQIQYLKEQKFDLFGTSVNIKDSEDIISYEKYSWEKKKDYIHRRLRKE